MKVKTTALERKKPFRIIFWGLILLIVVWLLFLDNNSFLKLYLKNRDNAGMEDKVKALQTQNDSLIKEIRLLKTDVRLIEKIAREKLGYQKPDETVYRFYQSDSLSRDKKPRK